MVLSEEQIQIIAESPLGQELEEIRVELRNCDGALTEDVVANLLGILILSRAALGLYAPAQKDGIAQQLLAIRQSLRTGSLKPEQFGSLVTPILNGSSDNDIWTAAIDFVEDVKPPTPPPSSIAPTFFGTPVKTSSSRLEDSETREIVEGELFEEIKRCTFRDVKGFWEQFFNPMNWREEQRAMLQAMLTAHNGERWADFPSSTDERLVWNWFRSLEQRFLVGAPHKLYMTNSASQFKERKGQMDIFFQATALDANSIFEYKDVLVTGELKKTYDTGHFKATLLQLARYVRSIFADQPTRRFVHGFSLCGSTMELWIFDRSGPYSSGPFNIQTEPDKFARAFVGYATMEDEAIGLDTFIERGTRHRYITVDDAAGQETRLRLAKPMARQRAIVCRGTTCYETQEGHVAKFSWVSDKRALEVSQLKLAAERGVKGVAKAVAYRRITTIADLRAGLVFPTAHRFREDVYFPNISSAKASTSISSQKRKSSSDNPFDKVDTAPEPKRQQSKNRSKLAVQTNQQSLNKAKPSLYTLGTDLWENRIYGCLVVTPAGQVISEFKTVRELLGAIRDAIRAHQSLYVTGRILHRDISTNNIIITKPQTADGFQGMLIDLDLAKVRDSGPSGARQQTGTIQFMAIEVLRKVDHTYRHDLESFFYVLLWMCARQSWRNGFAGQECPPEESFLRQWEVGSFKRIASAKAGNMTADGLEDIIEEFPSTLNAVKPLCVRIRSVLFPYDKDYHMYLGTPAGDPNQLYDPIIAAYDEAISAL